MRVGVRCTFFFFFKQKTAYEMRISDWSSDVCSSDLPGRAEQQLGDADILRAVDRFLVDHRDRRRDLIEHQRRARAGDGDAIGVGRDRKRGRVLGKGLRSEERRVGKEGVRKCGSLGLRGLSTINTTTKTTT